MSADELRRKLADLRRRAWMMGIICDALPFPFYIDNSDIEQELASLEAAISDLEAQIRAEIDKGDDR